MCVRKTDPPETWQIVARIAIFLRHARVGSNGVRRFLNLTRPFFQLLLSQLLLLSPKHCFDSLFRVVMNPDGREDGKPGEEHVGPLLSKRINALYPCSCLL